MTPQDFIAQWGAPGGVPGPAYALNEEQGVQSHFLDLCELLRVPKSGSSEGYRFEEKSAVKECRHWWQDGSCRRFHARRVCVGEQGAGQKPRHRAQAAAHLQPNPHGRPNSGVLKPWANGFELSRGPQHQWLIDFGIEMTEAEASLYEQPFAYVSEHVKPERLKNNRASYRKYWWRFAEARPGLRAALKNLPRFIATVAHSKHRFFVWLAVSTSPDQALITIARTDDTTFGILHSRFHELWSIRQGTSIGVGNDPRYAPTTGFETFPFPAGLTPADTAHQRTEALEGGTLIPADLPDTLPAEKFRPNQPPAPVDHSQAAITTIAIRPAAMAIAQAAQRLNVLRQAWLNPPEWTDNVPEVVPLGMSASPYPDRILPKPGFEKELAKRTLTKLYNLRLGQLHGEHAR